MYNHRLGLQSHTINWDTPWGVPLSAEFLPQALKRQGYRTAAFGKWHLGMFTEVGWHGRAPSPSPPLPSPPPSCPPALLCPTPRTVYCARHTNGHGARVDVVLLDRCVAWCSQDYYPTSRGFDEYVPFCVFMGCLLLGCPGC
jgi:hypothetical protein